MFMPQPAYPLSTLATYSLIDAAAGARVRIRALEGEKVLCARLLALGLTPGCEVGVCSNASPSGSRKITLRNSSLIITEEVARAIICSTLE